MKFVLNGREVSAVALKGDQSTILRVTLDAGSEGSMAGKGVVITTSAPMFVSPVDTHLDSNGHATFTIGPSFGAKGDGTIAAKVGNKTKSLDIRFTD